MAINKVVYGDQTLVDLTQDSVEANNLLEGETAHDRSGNPVTGTAKQGHIVQNSSGTDMTQRPKMQFPDSFVSDDDANGRTVVENIKEVSPADYASTTDEGIIVTDNGDDALIGPVSDDKVEVVADGVKTWKDVIKKLYTSIDRTKLSTIATIAIKTSSATDCFNIVNYYTTNPVIEFEKSGVSNNGVSITKLNISSSNDYVGYYLRDSDGTTTPYINNVPTDGTKITLYYGNRKATVDLQTTANRCVTSDNKNVQQVFDAMEFTAITGITPGTGISDASMMKASIGGRTLLRGSFKVTSARASGDTIMSGLGILGGGVGVTASPYSSGGMATYLNGALLSNSTLAVSANAYYFFGII